MIGKVTHKERALEAEVERLKGLLAAREASTHPLCPLHGAQAAMATHTGCLCEDRPVLDGNEVGCPHPCDGCVDRWMAEGREAAEAVNTERHAFVPCLNSRCICSGEGCAAPGCDHEPRNAEVHEAPMGCGR